MTDHQERAREEIPVDRRLSATAVWGLTVAQFNDEVSSKLQELYDNGFEITDIKFTSDSDGLGALILYRPYLTQAQANNR